MKRSKRPIISDWALRQVVAAYCPAGKRLPKASRYGAYTRTELKGAAVLVMDVTPEQDVGYRPKPAFVPFVIHNSRWRSQPENEARTPAAAAKKALR